MIKNSFIADACAQDGIGRTARSVSANDMMLHGIISHKVSCPCDDPIDGLKLRTLSR